ncbi:MAG TPA: LytTR family DNA-binding domain-containing protein [Bacteroidales bacterium]|nr:LytTR family DNA-binding domain-containing protein [Bacteroidales bacterium]
MKQVYKIFNRSFPKNYVVSHPLTGSLIFGAFTYLFVILYRPMEVHEAQSFSFVITILLYCIILVIPVFGIAVLINKTNCFSAVKKWTIAKEISSVVLILTITGLTTYFIGFIIEEPAERWNWATFSNAFFTAFLVGFVPLLISTFLNARFLFAPAINEETNAPVNKEGEELIHIESKLKKEELSFLPSQFIYAESDGNYVTFHLDNQGKSKEVMIRNSIHNIEQQLTGIPIFIRIHRSFIVNVTKVKSRRGNSLGYRLKLFGADEEVPVSRQNINKIDSFLKHRP